MNNVLLCPKWMPYLDELPFPFADENNPDSAAGTPSTSGGKVLTTWSSKAQQQQQPEKTGSRQSEEENSLNNNGGAGHGKSRSMPDMGDSNRRAEEAKLVDAFIRNKEERLSWGEADATPSPSGPIPMMKSKDSVNQYLKAQAAGGSSGRLTSIEERAEAANGSSGPSSGTSSKTGDSTLRSGAPSTPSSNRLPDLGFLQNDVGLWDAFFLHGRNSAKYGSVLAQAPPPPLPINEYLQAQVQRLPPVRHAASLRTLLPDCHKHLVPQTEEEEDGEVKPQLAVRSMVDRPQPEGSSAPISGSVQVVRVKEAWAETPEREQVVLRRRKKRGEEEEKERDDMDNNNSATRDKRRSFVPQDHVGRALDAAAGCRRRTSRRRGSDFPKVKNVLLLVKRLLDQCHRRRPSSSFCSWL